MENITCASDLKFAISELEIKQKKDWLLVKAETANAIEALKPANILKQSITNAVNTSSIKENLLANTVGLITGFASKALLVQNSTSPVKRLFGTLLQLGITKLIAKNPKAVSTVTDSVQSLFLKKIESRQPLNDTEN